MLAAANWSEGWTRTRLKVGDEDGCWFDLLKKDERKAESEGPLLPHAWEVVCPQTKKEGDCCKWWCCCYMAAFIGIRWLLQEKEMLLQRNKLLQTCVEITNHIVFNRYQSNFSAILHTWINNVDVEHKQESLDYRPLRRIVNQCKIYHLWCQW